MTMEFPPEITEEISSALKAGEQLAQGVPAIREAMVVALMARFANHTMRCPLSSIEPLSADLAGGVVMQIIGAYANIAGVSMAAERYGIKIETRLHQQH